jgi:hypothetical protein
MPRIKTAEESARREAEKMKIAALTLGADSTRPRDPRMQAEHYRQHLLNANRTIDTLQHRIAELEATLRQQREDHRYCQSLTVGRTAAEEARMAAFNFAINSAAALAEGPDGTPTPLSNAISEIKPSKSKFLN